MEDVNWKYIILIENQNNQTGTNKMLPNWTKTDLWGLKILISQNLDGHQVTLVSSNIFAEEGIGDLNYLVLFNLSLP